MLLQYNKTTPLIYNKNGIQSNRTANQNAGFKNPQPYKSLEVRDLGKGHEPRERGGSGKNST